jgi:hypothetical protein
LRHLLSALVFEGFALLVSAGFGLVMEFAALGAELEFEFALMLALEFAFVLLVFVFLGAT